MLLDHALRDISPRPVSLALANSHFPGFQRHEIVADLLYLLLHVLGISIEIDGGMAAMPQIIAHFIAPEKQRNYKYLK